MADLLRSLRPTHWVKNTVVFAGVIFARHLEDPQDLLLAAGAFAVFCALASAVYLFNDIRDRQSDRAHPKKQSRPIASGTVSPKTAGITAFLLAAAGLVGAIPLGAGLFITALIYVALNVAYSLGLKHIPILDVMLVAAGFVVRAVAGALVIDVAISPWLVVCTSLLALFLGFGKRRWELVSLGGDATIHRAALAGYSVTLLDQLIAVTTASTVVAYALYTLAPETQEKFGTTNLIWTLPFVVYGIFRYLYLIHGQQKGGNPTRLLLTDWPILVNVLLWLAAVVLVIMRG